MMDWQDYCGTCGERIVIAGESECWRHRVGGSAATVDAMVEQIQPATVEGVALDGEVLSILGGRRIA